MSSTANIKVGGMHCASCANNIKINLEKLDGVERAEVNFTAGKASIEYDEEKIALDKIKQGIIDTGYRVIDESQEHHHDHSVDEKKLKTRAYLAIALSLPLLLRMVWMWEVPGEALGASATDWVQNILTLVVVFVLGRQFHANALKALKRFQTDMDTLISLGTLSAYFFSTYAMFSGADVYFEGAATITALILLGRLMEQKVKDRASNAMTKLLELGAKTAIVVEKEGEKEKNIDEIKTGELVLVRAGSKVPLDGTVAEGRANLDEAMLTGESLPVFKENGAEVFAGTIVQDGAIQLKVTKAAGSTMLDDIIKTVEEAQSFKAPAQRLADKISSIFVPVVVGVSVLTFAGWFLASGDAGRALVNAVSVLIISCPCALGIATPIAIMVGSSVGAKRGILIKNGESFERAKKIDTIIFDKTGTLTEGKPFVDSIVSTDENEFPQDKIVKVAASLAKLSTHPLSQAVSEYAGKQKIEKTEIDNFMEISGRGLSGTCQKHNASLLLGNASLLANNNIEFEPGEYAGASPLYVAHGDQLIGTILIKDKIKASAKHAIEEIKKMDIEPIMVSGDNKATVTQVAEEIGIKKIHAEILPVDKQKITKKIQGEGKQTAFAGDGINDAPALVQSDLGIAMASGTDIAKESGDIIIMQNDPIRIAEAIRLSRLTFKNIKMNLFWAFFYNALAIPLAVAGLVNPMLAAAAMTFSDITVIGNSLRIYRKFK